MHGFDAVMTLAFSQLVVIACVPCETCRVSLTEMNIRTTHSDATADLAAVSTGEQDKMLDKKQTASVQHSGQLRL